MIIEQDGADVLFWQYGNQERLKNCNALKFARTMYNKEGEKYSEKEMNDWGFGKK